MHDFALIPLLIATWQTIYMVFIASFISVLFGLCSGVLLFITSKNQLVANRKFNHSFGFIINVTRSIPFIILMISIIPLTRLIVGSSIGTNAAIVPLTLAAIPFFARIAETALAEVPQGLIKAAQAMGASSWQIIYKVLIPESLLSLIKGATLTIIALIGYSAMAGAVGGGGLGELAINYGYQRFNATVMLETVILLVIIVQLIQSSGDYLARKPRLKLVAVICGLLWIISIGTQLWPTTIAPQKTLKVGIIAGQQEIVMHVAQQVAAQRYGLNLKPIVFNDYILPNTVLNNGEIDANIFQHLPYGSSLF